MMKLKKLIKAEDGPIPKMTQKLVFGCVGYAAHFLSSLAPCACTMVARSRQKICAAALPNSQLLNHFRYSNSVIYYDEEGNKLIRYWKSYEGQPAGQASTRSWRNNNPGNLSMGAFAKKNGAIGGAGRIPNNENKDLKFAVFPDYETGRKAKPSD